MNQFKVGDIVRYKYQSPLFQKFNLHLYRIMEIKDYYVMQPLFGNNLGYVLGAERNLMLDDSGIHPQLTPEEWFDIKKVQAKT